MIRTNKLTPAPGSIRKAKRIGRGQGSGKGGTSTKGHKGDQSRSGYFYKAGFEGGQMPMQRRLPKFGFYNPFRVEYSCLNLDQLQAIVDKHSGLSSIDPQWLKENGYIKRRQPLKILGGGRLKSSIQIKAHKFSEKARTLIEDTGGKALVIEYKD